jgi:ATP-dependent Lhr-like helicase
MISKRRAASGRPPQHGASFFTQLHEAVGGGYPGESLDALWSLVWRGLVTNDSLHPLRAYIAKQESSRAAQRKMHSSDQQRATFRSRRTVPATAQGRWSLVGGVAGRNLVGAGDLSPVLRPPQKKGL